MNNTYHTSDKINLDQLVSNLKVKDKSYARLSRGIQIMYWVMIPVYFVLTLIEFFDTKDMNVMLSGSFYMLAFITFAILFGKYHKEYNNVNYSLPTKEMLKKAAYRYQPMQFRTIWALVGVLFMDAGLYFDGAMDLSFWMLQLVFLGSIAVSAGIGLIIWSFKYKPLRDNALRLIKEIEGE